MMSGIEQVEAFIALVEDQLKTLDDELDTRKEPASLYQSGRIQRAGDTALRAIDSTKIKKSLKHTLQAYATFREEVGRFDEEFLVGMLRITDLGSLDSIVPLLRAVVGLKQALARHKCDIPPDPKIAAPSSGEKLPNGKDKVLEDNDEDKEWSPWHTGDVFAICVERNVMQKRSPVQPVVVCRGCAA